MNGPLDDSHLFEPATCDRCGVLLDRLESGECTACLEVLAVHRECERRLRVAGFFRVCSDGDDWVWRQHLGPPGILTGRIEIVSAGTRRLPEPGEAVDILRLTDGLIRERLPFPSFALALLALGLG